MTIEEKYLNGYKVMIKKGKTKVYVPAFLLQRLTENQVIFTDSNDLARPDIRIWPQGHWRETNE